MRTGTGEIDLVSSGDVVFGAASSGVPGGQVYTAGVPGTDYQTLHFSANVFNFPTSGGNVLVSAAGNIVGKGDIRAQAKQVFENLRGVLRAAGGDFSNLMKITTYITKIEDFPAVAQARGEVFQGELPASTLIVVKGLFHPDFLLEIEGMAAV